MKGIVVGIRKNRAIIMESGGSFREIKNHGYRMGQAIVVAKDRKPSPFAIAACLAVFFFAGIGGYHFYCTPRSYLYVDINPSLRLDVNGFDKVLSVVPLNDDATKLLEQCELDRSNGQSCINGIIKASLELGYLNEDNPDVEINLYTNSEEYRKTVTSIADAVSTESVFVTVFELDRSQNATALAGGISASRMRAVESYTEFFGGAFEENMLLLAEDTSQQIYARIRDYRRSTMGSDDNAYTDPQLGGAASQQGETPPISSMRSAEYSSRRKQAVDRYTAYFGGSNEDNAVLLEPLTIGEIYEMIKTDRVAGQTSKRSTDHAEE